MISVAISWIWKAAYSSYLFCNNYFLKDPRLTWELLSLKTITPVFWSLLNVSCLFLFHCYLSLAAEGLHFFEVSLSELNNRKGTFFFKLVHCAAHESFRSLNPTVPLTAQRISDSSLKLFSANESIYFDLISFQLVMRIV